MRSIRRIFVAMLIALWVMSCTACSGLDTLSDNLKEGVEQLGNQHQKA